MDEPEGDAGCAFLILILIIAMLLINATPK
jgi:hypothetical protein